MNPPAEMKSSKVSDPEVWVGEHGDYLFKYALMRTRNAEIAEDLVQETFLAALRARDSYTGKSSERTWLVGILKHKIIDHLRRSWREQPVADLDLQEEQIDELFNKAGFWKTGPSRWACDPRMVAEQNELRAAIDRCLAGLPERLAQAFALREIDQLDGEEICKVLGITPTNFWVMLHRARARLRRCLEVNWFGSGKR